MPWSLPDGGDGSARSPNGVTKIWTQLRNQLKLPRVGLHALRHTRASPPIAAGVHPKIASERAGHSSIAITMDTYSHMLPGMQEDAAQHIDTGRRTFLERGRK